MQKTNPIEQELPVWDSTTSVPAPVPTMALCSYGAKLTQEEQARVATTTLSFRGRDLLCDVVACDIWRLGVYTT